MTAINIDNFRGLAPRLNPKRLPAGVASVAIDVDLDNQSIRPWRTGKKVYEATHDILSFARVDCCWLTFDKCVELVTQFTPSCPFMIATGVRPWPSIALPEEACVDDWCRLGVACPDIAPIMGAAPVANPVVATAYRAYRYAYVNRYGQEGAGSPPSQVMNVTDGQSVTVSNFGVPDPEWCITTIRLYRLGTAYETGLEDSNPQNTEYFFVDEFPVGTPFYVDTIKDIDLGGTGGPDVFTNDEYLPPPADLRQIVSLENGRLAGISGNLIYLSDPNQPHAWFLRYVKKLLDKPLALAAIASALYVATDGRPYVIDGRNDCQGDGCQAVLRTRVPLPITSARSMVAESGVCYYASTNGLVGIVGQTAKLVSQSHLSASDWQKLHPNLMIGAWRDGYYHGYTDVEGIRFRSPEPEFANLQDIAYTNLSERPSAVWRDDDGELYYAIGREIFQWNAGDRYKEYTWESTPMFHPRLTSLTVAMIERSQGGNLRFVRTTNAGVMDDRLVNSQNEFRLNGRSAAAFTTFGFFGTAGVDQITAGTSFAERIRAEGPRAA